MNLTLAEGYTDYTFKNLTILKSFDWEAYSLFEPARRINAGPIIQNFLTNIEKSDEKSDGGKKIYLYGGHDNNIAGFMRAHNFSNSHNIPSVPDYGSGIIVEKYKNETGTYLRVRNFLLLNH